MKTVVIGHRGTGKTDLMRRLKVALVDTSTEFVDLDHEIEMKIGKTIMELFLDHGEPYFRELERQMFLEILQKPFVNLYLVVGAGFDLSVVPEEVRVLWVRRKTDLEGRIFLDRPRLHPELSPIEEFLKRAKTREQSYERAADEVYLMSEGIFENHHWVLSTEKALMTHSLQNVRGAVTLLASLQEKPLRWQLFKARYQNRGVDFFELRDDYLSADFIQQVLSQFDHEKIIFSFREVRDRTSFWESEEWASILEKVTWIDWPLELGNPEVILSKVPKDKLMISCHDESQFEELQSYQNLAGHLKFAPLVSDFSQLWSYHQWQSALPSHRSFLPRSEDSRWGWYRLAQKGHQLINFWRDGEGSAGDQPSLFEWMLTPQKPGQLAAVIGSPVQHSFTPIEQSDFFQKRNIPVLAIHVGREEWGEALPVLQKLGLCYAAVTSPHKESAAKWCGHKELIAVNTLYFDSRTQEWKSTSTDEAGFLELIEGVGMIAPLQKEIAVWGGGGTLITLEKALPHASYFSARSSVLRSDANQKAHFFMPKIVIWAAPRSPEIQLPPREWNPVMVYDLNYKEDSMGREYAQACGANYQSGLPMFLAQARMQRSFWQMCEERS